MTRKTTKIDVLGQRKREEIPVRSRPLPGLAVHRSVGPRGGWSLTHEASGLALVQDAPSPQALAAIAKRIAPHDWTGSAEQVRQNTPAVLALAAAIRDELGFVPSRLVSWMQVHIKDVEGKLRSIGGTR